MAKFLSKNLKQRGSAIVEYALLVALVALIGAASTRAMGNKLFENYGQITCHISEHKLGAMVNDGNSGAFTNNLECSVAAGGEVQRF